MKFALSNKSMNCQTKSIDWEFFIDPLKELLAYKRAKESRAYKRQ